MEKSPIYLFVMFSYNYPYNFIEQVWGEDYYLFDHLTEKFANWYEKVGAGAVMSKFYVELDGKHQQMLEKWILANYNG